METDENKSGQTGQKATILLPDIDWVEIPAGEFLYGDEREKRYLDSFQISRYPVTNAQYQTFILAGGYESDEWWEGLKKPGRLVSEWDQPNRPRTNVDWYEAVAFSRWLTVMLNQPVRLPTEEEWEKAARGSDGWVFPWGEKYINGYANVDESFEDGDGLKETTSVGLYPQGASSYGVMDMAGNVWEWCLNKGDHPDQIEADISGDSRVLRGGSWLDGQSLARADSRSGLNPDARSRGRGGLRLLLPVSTMDNV
ncbi:formylglycine-generating enzyme family protein [endosymbiont of Lamellibrachia barhami]|uniref:formylglycine-generating enzyme family protein n=1 Tax=endosymbiont of Lamellibrachia barhami TaxID=205975 RepID=UPI0015AE2FFC